MKIAYKTMNTVLEIEPDRISSLIVEEPSFFYQLLQDFKWTLQGEDRGVIFSKQDKPVIPSKAVVFMSDFIDFTLNQKVLLTKIINELEQIAQKAPYYERIQQLVAQLEGEILELTLQFPCELSCEKLNIQNVLKAAGIKIEDDYETLAERILAFMDLEREFEGKELFVLVNLRCLISNEEMQKFAETALTREHLILLIDNKEYPKLSGENRTIIDSDLCEF